MTAPTPKGGFMDKLGDVVAEKILPKLVELLWPKIAALFEQQILPKLVSLFPLFAASITKAVLDKIPGINLLENVGDLAEEVKEHVNVAVPDFDIPGLSEHFDLSEFINKTLGR